MLASMLIDSTPTQRVVVPVAAVVRQDDADYVFVEMSDKRFLLTPVKLATEQNGHRVVLEGLKPGMRIVSDGAFHLNNHRNLAEMGNGG
jgi:cobalt-zinc-cadmium efflux system membrane fusion protein